MQEKNKDKYRFDCGCEFDIIGECDDLSGIPKLDVDMEKINFDCPATWYMITNHPKGVFQLESSLGKQWTKKLMPENLEHLSALGSVLRPGCLQSVDENGVSITEHYCRRKNGLEETEYFHDALRPILKDSFAQCIYQEQSIQIATDIAGFDLQEADNLRKCITADTRFCSQQRGWVTLQELLDTGYEDDEFLVIDENGHKTWDKITNIWYTGHKTVRHVTTKSGYKVKATQYHQFLTNNGWKARMRLNSDDLLVAANSVDYTGADDISMTMAMIIAGILTEGYFVDYVNHATFVNHDAGIMQTFSDNFYKEFPNSKKEQNNPQVFEIRKAQKLKIAEHMKYGKSATKILPESMMRMTKETTRHFLSFMFACDGGVNKADGRIEYCSKSEKLVDQIKLLLLRFGITVFKSIKNNPEYGKFYVIGTADLREQRKFAKELTLYWPQYKIDNLTNAMQNKQDCNFTCDTIPSNIVNKMINQYPYVAAYEGGSVYTRPISRKKFKKLANKTQDRYWINFANSHHRYDVLDSANQVTKTVPVYDFSMNDTSKPFIVANGLVIHNSIGKKIPEEMTKLKTLFMDKAKDYGVVSEEDAAEIFSWIEKSQRYSFNKSHATAYGVNGYWSAYIKAHWPVYFYQSWLYNAREKQKTWREIRELVMDSRVLGVDVVGPSILRPYARFDTDGEKVYYGLTDIKGVGEPKIRKYLNHLATNKIDIESINWYNFVVDVGVHLDSTMMHALIESGALDHFNIGRRVMLTEFTFLYDRLTKKELEWCIQNKAEAKTVINLLRKAAATKKDGGAAANKNRVATIKSLVSILENPPTPLTDSDEWVINTETNRLGVSLTRHRSASSDIVGDTTCREILFGKPGKSLVVAEIVEVSSFKTKRGKNPGKYMAKMLVADESGEIEVLVFTEQFAAFSHLLFENNTILIDGYLSNDGTVFITKSIKQA